MTTLDRSCSICCGLILVLAVGLGCASLQPSADPWTTRYVGSPDYVWAAIHISLIDLAYDVETENRIDGTIRAVREADGEDPPVVLTIDQVMRSDTVMVFVRVAAGPDAPAIDLGQQEVLAQKFLAGVNAVLYK